MFPAVSALNNYRYLDVTGLPIAERTLHVLHAFEALRAGDSFVLLCDSDPHMIHLQLNEDSPHKYGWLELESGPVWRVLIHKGK